ncbi:(2Fe-2S)-binding protein [Nocardia huaxiensis]|uniref:(2Fe-2S)-binding protein n=1 Tax=Nocardia huaxiensis TaxID=2755382 RepID=A0A7D6V741_9NOCA|nr:(2Fe-2S)-binding protein [Nocardia huaxiensis]QLY29181.1 (2Fe-2S)-binding protein [Nocardia huaxiensis]UFS97317.1 (2Fe-2S)-binding protein [Nocardia huaxiensis]
MSVVPGTELLSPAWLAERIGDMGISWGTGDSRVSGTLWWCMTASSLVNPVLEAWVAGEADFDPTLEHFACEVRPDGGIERIIATEPEAAASAGPMIRLEPGVQLEPGVRLEPAGGCAGAHEAFSTIGPGPALRHTLSRVIPVVAEVSGASIASLWAIVADAIGNRALDAGDQEAGAVLAREVAGRLPVPRFQDIAGRTFVRRISCCVVFEVPGCEMCTSCPKRPAAQREKLLADMVNQD